MGESCGPAAAQQDRGCVANYFSNKLHMSDNFDVNITYLAEGDHLVNLRRFDPHEPKKDLDTFHMDRRESMIEFKALLQDPGCPEYRQIAMDWLESEGLMRREEQRSECEGGLSKRNGRFDGDPADH